MRRLGIALALVGALGGCSMFGGGKENKPKTAVLGERIPVLASEAAIEVEPSLADYPVTVPAPVVNTSWAQPGGNAQKAMGNLALGDSLSRVWSAKIAGSSKKARLAASPVVADGKLFVIDTNATIHAFDAKSGRSLWEKQLGGNGGERKALFGGGVSYDNGRLYATNGVGDAAALDATTGALIWKKRPGGPLRGAPTIAYDQVYVVAEDNQIFALKADSGDVVWNEAGTLETSGVFGVAAPAVGQGTVIAGFSSGELNAYRYENGRLVWGDALSPTSISTSVSSLSDVDADPVIDQGQVYAIGQGGRMVAMELNTGQRLWEINAAGIKTPWVAGEWLFVVTDDARLLCIQRSTGKVRWITQLTHWKNPKKKKGLTSWTGPLLANGQLILVSSRGEMVHISVADGKILSERKLGSEVHLSPIIADSTLYILDADGRITAWR
ncbi:MAG TPA: PQQ-binding-like beta-propeller repeat protein [Sphingomonadaceae bacterium]|nr:PQQ-binding-like beta-propeller repeat protein [Sphingomonadaceae bacterium]